MIDEDKCFHFTHGKKSSSIQELKEVIKDMEEEEFRHHVTNERNDFANWVEGVFKEKKLARRVRRASDKEGLVKILENFLKKKTKPKPYAKKEKKVISEAEKDLSEKEIKQIVDEAKQVIAKEELHAPKKAEHISHRYYRLEHHRFIVKEFIYGFILGLIFGLIMLGIIANMRF